VNAETHDRKMRARSMDEAFEFVEAPIGESLPAGSPDDFS
jgi:hypothetical protein